MQEIVYLFIDNAYLREVYQDLFVPLFGPYPIDYELVKKEFQAHRAYVYDCLDEVQKDNEPQQDYEDRVRRQKDEFDVIDKVEGIHVYFGHLTTGKRRQQKEVDVALAVDMLTHAYARNMSKAVLLAGDRDFRPLVESLVRMGTYVQLAYAPKTTAKELIRPTDAEFEIDTYTLCRWVKIPNYQNRTTVFPWVNTYLNHDCDPGLGMTNSKCLGKGLIGPGKHPLAIFSLSQGEVFGATVTKSPRDYIYHQYSDQIKLVKFVEQMHGAIEWTTNS